MTEAEIDIYIIPSNTIQCATSMAAYSAVNVRILFNLDFGLSDIDKADKKCTISNDLVYINNAFVQVKLEIILKYENQYFCLE